MRVQNLTEIQLYLSPIVESRGYYIYVAPLNKHHYYSFLDLIKDKISDPKDYEAFLKERNNLIEVFKKIDTNTEILVDTNLYVSKMESSSFNEYYELIEFLKENNIDYKSFIGSPVLIKEFEAKPNDEMNL